MNAQLAGKGDTRIGATSIGVGVRRILTLAVLIIATMIAIIYGMNQNNGKFACLACRYHAGLHGSNDPCLWSNHGCILEHALVE